MEKENSCELKQKYWIWYNLISSQVDTLLYNQYVDNIDKYKVTSWYTWKEVSNDDRWCEQITLWDPKHQMWLI